MKTSAITRLCGSVLAVSLAFAAGSVCAQQYPSKPIRIIVPTAAGGTGDTLARFVGERLSESLQQQVIVDNRPGANGIIALRAVVNAPADGYTLVVASSGNIAINPGLHGSKLPFNPERDLAPVTQIASTTQIMNVHPSLPARSVKDLIALAKARPNSIDYVNAGNGSTPHLNMVLFASMAGIKINGIVYKGSTPGRLAVLAGEVPLMIDGLIPSLPLIQSGRLRPLGVTSAKRVAILPNVPTIGETVPGYVGEIWYGVLAPAGTPPDIVAKLNGAIAGFLKSPDVRKRFATQGAEVVGNSPAEFAAFISREIVKWTQVIRESGARVD